MILNQIKAPAATIASVRPKPTVETIDITRGARLHGICSSEVIIEAEILEDFAEMDVALGQNLVGVVLAVLACHLEMNSGGTHRDQVTICTVRREDAVTVELDLQITHTRRQGRERIFLRKGEEREVEALVAAGHRLARAEKQALAISRTAIEAHAS
jgi:hypothetical protein